MTDYTLNEENMRSSLAKEFEVVLRKFFNDEKSEKFISRLNEDALIINFMNSNAMATDDSQQLVGSFFTVKLRLLADRIITFGKRNLEDEQYYWFLIDIVNIIINKGELNLAYDLCSDLVKKTEKNKDLQPVAALSLYNLADLNSRTADWQNAVNNLKKARTIFDKLSDQTGLCKCEFLFGNVYLEQGDLDVALARFENCLSIAKSINHLILQGLAELNFGIIHFIKGNLDDSAKFYLSALEKFEELNDYKKIADIHLNLGLYYEAKENYDLALEHFNKAVTLALEHRYLSVLGITYLNISLTKLKMDDLQSTTLYANKAMEICYQINDKLTIADVYKIRGIVSRKLGDFELSEDFLMTSLIQNNVLKNELNYAETAAELGILYSAMELKEKSDKYLNKAKKYFTKINSEKELERINRYLNK